MPKIIIDGKEIECRDGIPVLQAALEAGWDVPHYCYHPGLSVVASCRLCLMEQKMPHPQTKEMGWAPKLFPSCQTPVKDGMEVRFHSESVENNQKHVMEYYLLNHPLDCPVCDKAGECSLQDYSEKFGNATSRMVEDKHKNPKKDIGPKTLLYQDRCVLCTRCVRFADEIAGTGELAVVERGSRGEIDVFPGEPLANDLQGNVVDLCPVGCLLDKQFLFRQRVWNLQTVPSVSPADSSGACIWIDANDAGVHRVRPRFNERVNEWWISDEQRHGFEYVNREDRLTRPRIRENGQVRGASWEEIPAHLRAAFAGDGSAFVISPMLSNEEAWLLATFARQVAPNAVLACGHVPVEGQDRSFPKGFTIRAEKAPNRGGVERILAHFGGPQMSFDELCGQAADGTLKAVYVYGGYPAAWITPAQAEQLSRLDCLVVHDLFDGPLTERADLVLPAAPWTEREGSFTNCDGLVQAFERARPPRSGIKAEGQFFQELCGLPGLFRSAKIRTMLGESIADLAETFQPRKEPEHAH